MPIADLLDYARSHNLDLTTGGLMEGLRKQCSDGHYMPWESDDGPGP